MPRPKTVEAQVIRVRRDEVTPDPEQPRKCFNEEALQDLASSLSASGLLSPIIVRPNPDPTISKYRIIAGERRWIASGLVGWERIPAIIREDLDDRGAVELQLLENIVRQDLSPVEEARAFQRAIDSGYTPASLSQSTGIPTGHITLKLQMLAARPEVLQLVETGQVKPLVASALGKLSHDSQGIALRHLATERLTYTEVLTLCERLQADEAQVEMFQDLKPLSEEDQKAVRTFAQAFEGVSRVLDRLNRMEEKSPGSLARALEAEQGVVEVQIDEATRGLNRVKKALQTKRIQEKVGV